MTKKLKSSGPLFSLLDAGDTWIDQFHSKVSGWSSPPCFSFHPVPVGVGSTSPGQCWNPLSLFMRGWRELCSQLIH